MALTTVSYRELTDKEVNPISKIYDMYVQGLVRLLKMFSLFLLFYSLGVIIIRVVELIEKGFPSDIEPQIVLTSSIALNFIGALVGIIGIRAVRIQSKGSSLTFFSFIVLYDVVYLVIQSYFLYYTQVNEPGKFFEKLLGGIYSVKFSVYYLVLTFFVLIFMTVKALRFHNLLTKLIAKRQFSNKETLGLPTINE